MAFARKKQFAKLVADGNSDTLVLVLNSVTPVVLAGGIVTGNGGSGDGKVNVTACKYMAGSVVPSNRGKVNTAPAITAGGVTLANTGDSVVLEIATNTIKAMVAASVAAAVAAGTHLQLATGAFTSGDVTPTAKRRLLMVGVDK